MQNAQLVEIIKIDKSNKNLRDQVLSVATENEIARIANDSGFEFKYSQQLKFSMNFLYSKQNYKTDSNY